MCAHKEAVIAVIRRATRGRLARTPLVLGLLVLAFAPPADGGTTRSRRAVTLRNGWIAFATDQKIGVAGLVSVNPRGGGLTMLSATPLDAEPIVSPDGGRLALVVGDQLEVLAIDGTHRVLIDGGRSPTWSPDGSRLAFVQPATSEIEIAAAAGGSVRDLGVSGSEPVWSPAGDWIAFFSGYTTLELIHPDGTGRTVVATNAYSDPSTLPVAWSHDGAWLSFGAVPADTNVLETNVIRADGSGLRSLGNTSAPAWSPRADVLAFGSSDNGFEVAAPDGSALFSSDSISGIPVWSPNGAAVAVGSLDIPGEWIVVPSTGTTTHVSIGGIPAWSPDSTRLAAVRSSKLRVVAATGGRARVLANGAYAPALWLRTGRIAYVTQGRVRSVIETSRYGWDAHVLVSGPARFDAGPSIDIAGLAWAPDGSMLAYLYATELRILRQDGSGSRLLARNVTDTPTWSPDGRSLAFAADGLRIAAVAGGKSRLLTRAGSTAPAWSPDGRRIAFSTGEDYGPTSIETIRYDGTGLTVLASATAEDTGDVLSGPKWSPDGKTILYFDDEYFCGSKCDELHLMLMRPNGTGRRRLPGYVDSASWSPDGSELLGHTGEGSLLIYNLRTGRHNFLGRTSDVWSWQPLPAKRRPRASSRAQPTPPAPSR